jgi:hypothetical protein
MNKVILLYLLFFVVGFSLMAQEQMEDVVYLKNGSIIRGEILKLDTEVSVKIQLYGGSIFVYPMDEVEKITKEPSYMVKKRKQTIIKKKGYFNTTETGINLGSGRNSYYYSGSSGFSFHNINGIYFNHWFAAGIGVGIDIFGGDYPISPVYLRLQGNFLESAITPFYFVDGGYGIPWQKSRNENTTISGGFSGNLGFGIKFHTASALSWHFSVGYKYQRKKEYVYYPWNGDSQTTKTTYQRLSLRIGMSF